MMRPSESRFSDSLLCKGRPDMAATPSRWLPLLLAVCIFMQMLDAKVLNTALPQMATDPSSPTRGAARRAWPLPPPTPAPCCRCGWPSTAAASSARKTTFWQARATFLSEPLSTDSLVHSLSVKWLLPRFLKINFFSTYVKNLEQQN